MSTSKINPFFMALMPLSQALSWYLIGVASSSSSNQQQQRSYYCYSNTIQRSILPLSKRTNDDDSIEANNYNENNNNHDNNPTIIRSLYRAIFPIASFYCIWALYNTIVNGEIDLGLYTLGLVAVGSYYEKYWLTIIGHVLVWLNFVIPSFFIVFTWDAKTVAGTIKHDSTQLGIVWAYIFKAYFISNIALWSLTFYCFINNINKKNKKNNKNTANTNNN